MMEVRPTLVLLLVAALKSVSAGAQNQPYAAGGGSNEPVLQPGRRPVTGPQFLGGVGGGQPINLSQGADPLPSGPSFVRTPIDLDGSFISFPGQPGNNVFGGAVFGGVWPDLSQITSTVTLNEFVTSTDVAYRTANVTLTQVVVRTTTVQVNQLVSTPESDRLVITTRQVVRPVFVTVTETKSDFRLVTLTSSTEFTVRHTSYIVSHSTFTTTATEVVSVTSALTRTVVSTETQFLTDFHTVYNTAYVRAGGYYN